jgi:Putative glycosyl hydrolase of unknown function (DUF1680).
MKKHLLQKATAWILSISLIAGCGLTAVATEKSALSGTGQAKAAVGVYQNNQGKLKENPFIQLPLGAVRADSWLENQLLLMKQGLTGNMKYFPDYNKETSAWLGSSLTGSHATWENGPYFLRGLMALAYALDDEELIAEALEWVKWSIDNQRSDGYFGPATENSWWSRMPMLCAIRDFYEAVDAKPESERTEMEHVYYGKVLDFLERYFHYQEKELPRRPLSNWADARGGDNLEVLYWFYNKRYDAQNPSATDWLISLGDLIYSQTQNWEDIYNNSTVRQHVVNTSQGMKTPAVYAQYKADKKYRDALANGIDHMGIDYGRIDGLPNSDEAARDNRSTRGSETCGTVEGLMSTEIAMKIIGEAWMGDRLETLAYNALPAAYPSDYSGHTYYILQNQVVDTLGNHEFDCDHGDSSAFGAPLGFDCCFANNHMGWAKFVQNMWMATAEGGLALTAYGPNHVTAKVAGGKTAKFQQETDYPFRDTVNLTYYGEDAEFDLKLHIPEWAKTAQLMVNGTAYQGVKAGEFYTIRRNWTKEDKVTAVFKSEVELTTWYNNSTAVQKGALVYGLQIDEDWRTYEENDARELKVEHKDGFPLREVYPASAWNYGLLTGKSASFEVIETEEVGLQPFQAETAPIQIKAKGQILPEWTLDGNLAGPQPYGPVAYDNNAMEDITLIPYGCGRLRITHFPTLGDVSDVNEVVRTDSRVITRNGITYQEFDNLVVPKAKDYNLSVKAQGTGKIIINSKYTQEVAGDFTINNLKGKLSGGFKFDAGQYNNIRFTGDIKASEVKVEMVEREITDIRILSSKRTGSDIQLTTNLDPQETPYRVVYGTVPGNYTNTIRGFSSGTATLTGLDETAVYYVKVLATICGVEQESQELLFETAESEGGLKPNPNVPAASYEGFNTLNYMTGEQGVWTEYDPENAISIQAATHPNSYRSSEIKFGTSEKMKVVLDVEGSPNWVDYVVETELTLDELRTNNGGIIFRASEFGNGPDDFKGYFAGVGLINGKPGLLVGLGNGGSWHTIEEIFLDIKANQKYTIRAVVYGTHIAIYLDGNLVKVFEDDRFAKGTVGVRSYREAMTFHNVTVRPITEEDLKVFENEKPELPEQPEEPEAPEVPANLQDDFSTGENWTHVGDQNLIQISDGAIHLGRSTNVKSLAGDVNWSNYVYCAEVTLENGNGNAGLLIRSSQESSGADNYYGYYFGINDDGYEIGKSSNKWSQLKTGNAALDAAAPHELKVIAYGDAFLFCLDGEFIYTLTDSDHARGRVGLRGYNRAFSVNHVFVRPLTEEEIALVGQKVEESKTIQIEAFSAHNGFQIKYPRVMNATSYRVLFGKESGNYTDEFVDIFFNGYKGSGIFSHDKVAVSTLEPGRYYVKMIGLNGRSPVVESKEITVTTGLRAPTEAEQGKLTEAIQIADKFDAGSFTSISKKRFARAQSYANSIAAKKGANQIEYATAAALLGVAMKTPDSTSFAGEPKPPVIDTSALEKAIADANKIDKSVYTEDSYAKVQAALEAAKKADKTSQSAVDAAVKNLRDAIAGLKKRPVAVKPPVVKPPAKNKVVTQGLLVYKVTKSVAKNGTVTVQKPKKKTYKNITIPKTIKLNGYTFQVTSVSSRAFKNCKKLKSVKIGDNVSKIDKYAFMGCGRLQSVTIGKGLTQIGSKAFYKDKSLKKVIIKSSNLKKVNAKAFSGISKKAVIDVPNKKIKKYKRILKKGNYPKNTKIR